MAMPREQLLELYTDAWLDEPVPDAPVTPHGKRHAAALERAGWCLATGQPYDVWERLTADERDAFVEAVNLRNRR